MKFQSILPGSLLARAPRLPVSHCAAIASVHPSGNDGVIHLLEK